MGRMGSGVKPTGSLASQRHPGKFPKVPGRRLHLHFPFFLCPRKEELSLLMLDCLQSKELVAITPAQCLTALLPLA